jgi:perosamine synthetase
MSDPIPLAVPCLSGREWEYVKQCLDTNAVAAAGDFVPRLERAVADFLGVPYAAAFASGSAALHLAMRVAGLGAGDAAIVPDFTFVAPANALRYCGATPIFVDIDPATASIAPAEVEELLRARCERRGDGTVVHRDSGLRVKALVVVHLYGHPADLDPLRALAREYGLVVVDDAAECLGARYRGTRVGADSELACLSFNGNKVVTAGAGGMVVSTREDLVRRARHLGGQAKAHPTDYLHDDVGYNYRLPNINAALGLAQVEVLEQHLARKRQIAAAYARGLADVRGLSLMGEQPWATSSFWLNTAVVAPDAFGRTAAEVVGALRSRGIEARRVWPPLHLQAPFRDCPALGTARSEWLFAHALNLPSSVGIRDDEIARVVGEIRSLARG